MSWDKYWLAMADDEDEDGEDSEDGDGEEEPFDDDLGDE